MKLQTRKKTIKIDENKFCENSIKIGKYLSWWPKEKERRLKLLNQKWKHMITNLTKYEWWEKTVNNFMQPIK